MFRFFAGALLGLGLFGAPLLVLASYYGDCVYGDVAYQGDCKAGGGQVVGSGPSAPQIIGGGSVIPTNATTTAATSTELIATTTAPSSTVSTSALSSTQVQAILSLLTSFGADANVITNVANALNGTASKPSDTTSFARDLELGNTGADVQLLQQFLNTHGFVLAKTGPGSLGNETTKFGNATKYQLIQFQKTNGITPAAGYFGPKTRAIIVSH